MISTFALASLVISFLVPVGIASASSALPARWNVASTTTDKIRGVNIGGHLVLECWLVPTICQEPYKRGLTTNVTETQDEWTLCSLLGQDACHDLLQGHWATFITESDFSAIKAFGLNTVRLPIGYWALTDMQYGEPYVTGQLPYLQRMIQWAYKYGLDVVLDLHAAPGSQNGYDNSGKAGTIEFGRNQTNVAITLSALSKLTDIAVAPSSKGAVKAIELLNEPFSFSPDLPLDFVMAFHLKAYSQVQSRIGARNTTFAAPIVVFQSAFQQNATAQRMWADFYAQHSIHNPMIDEHTYFVKAWAGLTHVPDNKMFEFICANLQRQDARVGVFTGELSLATQTSCFPWSACINETIMSQTNYSVQERIYRRQLWEAQQSVFEHGNSRGWFMWTWKTSASPLWDYRASVALGFIPRNLTERHYPFHSATNSCIDTSKIYPPPVPDLSHFNVSGGFAVRPSARWATALGVSIVMSCI